MEHEGVLEGVLVWERIAETTRMCDREQPIYEQISNFSIALYVFGYFSDGDLLSADDVDHVEAGSILKDSLMKLKKKIFQWIIISPQLLTVTCW